MDAVAESRDVFIDDEEDAQAFIALDHLEREGSTVSMQESGNDVGPSGEIVVGLGANERRTFNMYSRQRSNDRRHEMDMAGDDTGSDMLDWRKYEDFTTIDWVRDSSLERRRQMKLAMQKPTGFYDTIISLIGDGWQGWVVVFLTGLFTGVFATIIDVGTDWLSDVKIGICPSAFWLNQTFCCWTSREANCQDWSFWYQVAGIQSEVGRFLISYMAYVALAVAMATYCSVLVLNYGPYAAGSGIPEVKTILSGFVIKGFLGLHTLLIKTIGLVLSVSSGLSLGKEGPYVHVACCVANVFTRIFAKYRHNEAKKREIMSAACAAGVSVAFGAPVGGVLFSLEEASYYFPHKTMWRSFFCALTAATTLQYFDPFRTGRLVMFYVHYDSNWHLFELPGFLFVGILGGLYGAFYTKANVAWCRYKSRTPIKHHPVLEVALVTAMTALLRYPLPYLRMSTTLMIHQLFDHCYNKTESYACQQQTDLSSTVALLVLSALLTAFVSVFTFGIKVPAGLFIPSMAVGTLLGSAVGRIMERYATTHLNTPWLQDACHVGRACVEPGLYAVVGAAAFLSGVTRTTVSLVVIMFELTGGLMYIIPVMIAVLVSKWVADATGVGGIYDEHIKLRGYPYLDAHIDYHHLLYAGDVMHPRAGDPALCVLSSQGNTVGSLSKLLEEMTYKGFPLIDKETKRTVIGYVNRAELQLMISQAEAAYTPLDTPCLFTHSSRPNRSSLDFRRCVDRAPLQVGDDMAMDIVIDLFVKMGLRYVLVCSGGELAGIITKKDILRHLEEISGSRNFNG